MEIYEITGNNNIMILDVNSYGRYGRIIRKYFITLNLVIITASLVFHINDVLIGRGLNDIILDMAGTTLGIISILLVLSPLHDRIAYIFSVIVMTGLLCVGAAFGGAEGQLINWLFLIPFYSWLLLGRKGGLTVSFVVILSILFIYLNPLHLNIYTYNQNSLIDSLVLFFIASFLNVGVHMVRDRIMQDMEESLDEKELLIREVYHRTKNNLAGIVNIMKMQLTEEDDEALLKFGHETLSRINSMIIMNEKLHQSHSLVHIDLGDFLHSLADDTVKNMGSDDDLDIDFQFVSVHSDSSLALNCAVIMHEALTNSLKYADRHEDNRQLSCKLYRNNDHFELMVRDNGQSESRFSLAEDNSRNTGLGIRLIRGLGNQLPGGHVSLDLTEGTCWQFSFSIPDQLQPISP